MLLGIYRMPLSYGASYDLPPIASVFGLCSPLPAVLREVRMKFLADCTAQLLKDKGIVRTCVGIKCAHPYLLVD